MQKGNQTTNCDQNNQKEPAKFLATADDGTTFEGMRAAPTASFELPYVVTGEPPRFAVERAFPPAPVLLPAHADDVALGERELILIGLLEGEACLDQQVATPTAL